MQTRRRILDAAKKLFTSEGFEGVTIEALAKRAEVSAPTVYSLFQSKRGVMLALMDEALPTDQFEALVEEVRLERSAKQRLKISAKIARQIYDAEKAQMDLFRGASMLTPELKELERKREERRYQRQEESVKIMMQEGVLQKDLSLSKVRDILWAFTGRDLYRMCVIERDWTSDQYETWLGELLAKVLLEEHFC